MKKVLALFLTMTFIFTMTTIAFGSSSTATTSSASSDTAATTTTTTKYITIRSHATPSSKYAFISREGNGQLLNTTTATAEQLKDASFEKSLINELASVTLTKSWIIKSKIGKLVDAAKETGKAVEIKSYVRTDEVYRLNSATSDKDITRKTQSVVYELYTKDNGKTTLYAAIEVANDYNGSMHRFA
jgi:hypothetical protein